MKALLPVRKIQRIKTLCSAIIVDRHLPTSTASVANLVKTMVTYLPVMDFGKLHYRSLERDKIEGSRSNFENFDAKIVLSNAAIDNVILRWIDIIIN